MRHVTRSYFIFQIWTLVLAAFVSASNKHDKRGVQGGAYSYSHVIHDHGPYHAPSHDHYAPVPLQHVYYAPHGATHVSATPVYDSHHNLNAVINTITKEVPVPVYQPYPVQVAKPVPYPVKYAIPVAVDRPYPVAVEKPIPYEVQQPVPYPVKYSVPVAQPVPVYKPYDVSTPVPYAVYDKSPEYNDGDEPGEDHSEESYSAGGSYHSDYDSRDRPEDEDRRHWGNLRVFTFIVIIGDMTC